MTIDKIFARIKTKDWYYEVTRKFNWFVEWSQIQANTEKVQKKYSRFVYTTKNGLILNGDEYYSEEELDDWNLILDRKFAKDPNFFEKLAQETFSLGKKTERYEKELKRTEFKSFGNKELGQKILEFGENFVVSMVPAWTRPDLYLDSRLRDLFKKELKIFNKKTKKLISKISTHSELAKLAFSEEPIALLSIAENIQDNHLDPKNLPQKIDKQLNTHLKKYSWMKNPTIYEEVAFQKEEYLERIKEMLTKNVAQQLRKISRNRKKVQEEYEKVIKENKIKGRLLKLCETVRNFSFLRTYTREVNERLFFVGRHTILKECAGRLGISKEEMTMLEPQEISNILNGKKLNLKKIIKKRLKGFAIIWLDRKLTVIFGQKANELQKEVSEMVRSVKTQAQFSNKQKIIKGTPASQGKAKGKVKILLNHHDVSKMKRGNILVATMTTPDFIMGMEKTAAFVTDEGGITCHAAIVAREFGVPCVVGTLNATKVLKDGDLVVVNANKGLIKVMVNT